MDREPIPLAPNYSFRAGERVCMIGNPSVEGAMTMRNATAWGTFSAMVRIDTHDLYQVDAKVNPGSSGGPILNEKGEVVAVIAMKSKDEYVDEIRKAMGQLDDAFAKQQATEGTGITYGVPLPTVMQAIQQVRSQSPAQAMRVNYDHAARAATERLRMLAGIRLLHVMINVPMSVRQQAFHMQFRAPIRALRDRASTAKYVEIIPAPVAQILSEMLSAEGTRELVKKCGDGLEKRIEKIAAYEQGDAAIGEALRSMVEQIKQADRLVQKPPTTYQSFSLAVIKLGDGMAANIDSLVERLHMDQPAYGP
jgi:hypothetical protein